MAPGQHFQPNKGAVNRLPSEPAAEEALAQISEGAPLTPERRRTLENHPEYRQYLPDIERAEVERKADTEFPLN